MQEIIEFLKELQKFQKLGGRDLFEQGKKNASCMIVIDEIDAVGRNRAQVSAAMTSASYQFNINISKSYQFYGAR